jgi:hypothetical protein
MSSDKASKLETTAWLRAPRVTLGAILNLLLADFVPFVTDSFSLLDCWILLDWWI